MNKSLIGGSCVEAKDFKEYNSYLTNAYAKKIKGFLRGERVICLLDAGCSRGSWGYFFKWLGVKRLVGIDFSKRRLKRAKNNGYDKIVCGDMASMKLKGFDAVVSISTLIHVLEDVERVKVFKKIYDYLKPGGVFVFNVVNDFYRQPSTYCRYDDVSDVTRLLELTGFKVESVEAVSFGWRSYPIALPFLDAFCSKRYPEFGRVVWFKARKVVK